MKVKKKSVFRGKDISIAFHDVSGGDLCFEK